MSLLAWLRRLATPTSRPSARGRGRTRRPRSPWGRALLRLESLEDRLAPASSITIVLQATGGTLDGTFITRGGTIRASDLAGQAATLSTGALTNPNITDISITAENSIVFGDFGSGGSVALPETAGHTVAFQTLNTGSTISFATLKNILSTNGASFSFSAGTTLTTANLTINNPTSSSSISLIAGTQGNNLGDIDLGGSANAGVGPVTLSASNAIFNSGAVANNVTGSTLGMTARAGIGTSGSPITTAVSAVAAQTLQGDLFVSNTGDVTVGFTGEPANVFGLEALGTGGLGSSGNVSLVDAGNVFVNRSKDTVQGAKSATVTTTGTGNSVLLGGGNTGGNAAVFSNGAVTVTAGGNVLLGDTTAKLAGDIEGGGAILVTAGADLVMDEGSVIDDTGAGSVTATAVGNFTLTHTDAAGASIVTHGGAMSLGQSSTFTLDSGTGGQLNTTLGGAPGGAITITADSMTLNDPINAGTGVAQLQAASPSRIIDVGTATPGRLGLTNTELDLITSSVLRIGSVGNLGGIVVTANITQIGSNFGALSLITGGLISEGPLGALTVNQLALQAGQGMQGNTALLPLTTGVESIAFSNTGGAINLDNTQALTITGVDTVTTATNTGTTTNVVSQGPMTVAVNVTGTGNVTLQAQKPTTNPPPSTDLVLKPAIAVTSTGAGSGVTLSAADNISVPVGASVNGASSVTLTAGQAAGSTKGISLLGSINTSSVATLTAPGDITLSTVLVLAGSPAKPAGTLNVTSTAGNIRDDGIDGTVLSAVTYNFSAAKSIGGDAQISRDDVLLQDPTFAAALDLTPAVNGTGLGTSTINVTQTGAGGNVQLRDTDGKFDTRMLGTLSLVGTGTSQFAMIASGIAVTGSTFAGDVVVDTPLTLSATANDNLLLAATNGNNVQVSFVSPVVNNGPTGGATLVTAAGTVTVNSPITAHGAVNLTAGGNTSGNGVTVSAAVTTAGGGITVDSNRDVTLNAALSTTGASGGAIKVNSAESLTGAPSTGSGAVLMNGGSSLDTSSSNGAITVQAGGFTGQGGNVTLTTANAGTGPVSVTAFSGNILDGNGSNNLNVTGGALSLTANGTGGINLDINTDKPATAGVTATAPNGPINLRSAGQMQVANVNAATNAVNLTAGSLTSLSPNPAIPVATGATVSLTATTGTIGSSTAGQEFAVSATTLNASTNNQGLYVAAVNGAAVGTVNAGAGDVLLLATNGNLTSTGTDIVGNTVTLDATGSNGNASLGSPTAPLLVAANVLSADVTGGGSLNVRGDSDLQVEQAGADGGPVNLSAPGHTLTAVTPVGNAVLFSAGGTVTVQAGNLFTTNTSGKPDVQATNFILTTSFDVGSATARLQTAVNQLTAQGRNIFINNSGPLTLAVIPGASPFAVTGTLDVTSSGTLTVATQVVAVAAINLATTAATADLVIGPGQSLSSGQTMDLSAGRSFQLQSTSAVGSRTNAPISVNVGTQSATSNSVIAGAVIAGSGFSVTGGAGNDVLTIDFTGGASLPNGMSFDGGGGANTLVYSDLGGNHGHVYVLTTSGINRDGGKSNVATTNVQGLSVVGSLTNDLFIVQGTPAGSTTSLRGQGGANAFYISSDAPVCLGDFSGLGGPLLIDPGTGPSNLLVASEFGRSGPDDVTLTSSTMVGTAGNGFSINYAPQGFLRGNVKLVVGGGNDIVRVIGTAAQAVTSLYTVGGNATISVVTAGGAQNTLQGTLDIDAGSGAAQFIFSEANSQVADNLTLSANRLTSSTSGFVINFTASGGAFSRGFSIYTGAANDVVTVNGTAPGSFTYINTGASQDLVTVNVSGPDADTLVIDGGDNGAPVGNLLVVNDVVGGATAAVIPTGNESGLVRFSYPTGLRDVYFFSMDRVFTNPAAG